MTKKEMLKMKDSPSGHYTRVDFTFRDRDHCSVPIEIVEHEPEWDDEDIADWIYENNRPDLDEFADIQITSIE
jgi:hypothetical protein